VSSIPNTEERAGRLAALLEATNPAARARAGQAALLPVLPELEPLLPDGGLRRGTVVEAPDIGMLLALAAGPSLLRPDGWTCVIGMRDLGLAAADAYGWDLSRTLLVDYPGEHWQEIVATMAPAVDTLVVRPTENVTPTTARRLEARLRQHAAVLLTPSHWPGSALRVAVESKGWTGLGSGWGQLCERRIVARTSGRGGGLGRSAELLLPNGSGTITALEPSALQRPVPDRFELAAAAY